MPKIHYVAKAAKDNRVAKKGEPYYWVKLNRFTPKLYSKDGKFKPSQLTASDFLQRLYEIDENFDQEYADKDAMVEQIDTAISDLEELRDETQEKFDNMPEGLQQGDTGQMLEECVSGLDDYISDLESAKSEIEDEDKSLEDARSELDGAVGGHGL